MPLFLTALFTIVQASLWVYASSVAQAAAQDGVRAATVLGGTLDEGEATAGAILQDRRAGSDWTLVPSDDGRALTLTVTGQSLAVVPGLRLEVTESASLPWEGR